MKYKRNIDSCQVPEKLKTHEYKSFLTYKPLGKLFYKKTCLWIFRYIYAIKIYYLGEEHWHDKQNRGEITPGELRHGSTCDPIRVDIYVTRHLGHGVCVCRSGEDASGKLFSLSCIRLYKKPLTHHMVSNYDSGKEIWTGTPESSDFREEKKPRLS